MKLEDLSDNQRRVLTLIHESSAGGLKQGEIRRQFEHIPKPMPGGTVSSSLARLEAYGLIEKPDRPGKEWMMTAAGEKLFRAPVTAIAAPKATVIVGPMPFVHVTATEEPMPPEPEQAQEPVFHPLSSEMDEVFWENRRITDALNTVRLRLRGRVPASALRVYREVLDALPAELADVLTPITELVEAYQ